MILNKSYFFFNHRSIFKISLIIFFILKLLLLLSKISLIVGPVKYLNFKNFFLFIKNTFGTKKHFLLSISKALTSLINLESLSFTE